MIDEKTIITILRKEGVIESKKRIYLQPLLVSQYRIDACHKKVYRVLQNENTLFHLTVGPDLTTLYNKSKQFYIACPSIACKPLFFIALDDKLDFFGREFVEGQSLEYLCENNQITEDKIVETINVLKTALEATFEKSTIENAESELLGYQERLNKLTIFNVMDKTFLDHIIFPFIGEEMIKVPQRRRWSNGDFIERNIFLDGFGHAKLIDYEFATNTHFYDEDWIRFEKFSHLPAAIKSRIKDNASKEEPWVELFFWLRQILYEQQLYVPQYCNEKILLYINSIKQIILEHAASYPHSVFLNTLQINEIAESTYVAQLFVDTGLGLNEEQSITKIIRGNEQQIEFDLSRYKNIMALRFDPLNERVVLRLRQVKILTESFTLCSQITYTTNALYHRDDLLIFDTNDPQVLIDTKDIIKPKTLIIQIDYHAWCSGVDKYINEEKSAVITAKDAVLLRQAEELQGKESELQRQADELRIINETVLRQAEELQGKESELQHQADELRIINETVHHQAEELQIKEAELQRQADELRIINETVFRQAEELQGKEAELQHQAEALRVINETVLRQADELQGKDTIIVSLNNRCIEALKGKYEILSGILKEKELAIETLQQDIEQIKNMNQALEDQGRQKDTFINVLENSLSLRLGRGIGGIVKAPVQVIGRFIKG